MNDLSPLCLCGGGMFLLVAISFYLGRMSVVYKLVKKEKGAQAAGYAAPKAPGATPRPVQKPQE
jgi:hypothetical protein